MKQMATKNELLNTYKKSTFETWLDYTICYTAVIMVILMLGGVL